MKFLPIDNLTLLDQVSEWLGTEGNYKWLDFGNGVMDLNPTTLSIMVRKKDNFLRVFTDDLHDIPIGIVGLTDIKQEFRTATIWIVLGERRFSMKGFPRRAARKMLTIAFTELGLNSVNAWAVTHNFASIRLIKELNFKPIGVQRQSHIINDNVYDRLWFDILAKEHVVSEGK